MPEPSHPTSVTFCEYPKLIYIWPLILMGPLFWFFAGPTEVDIQSIDTPASQVDGGTDTPAITGKVRVAGDHEILGWIYIVVLFLVVLTIGVDVERNYAFFWAALLAVFWLTCWLLSEKNFPVFSHIYNFFADLNAGYDRGTGLVVSIFLAVPYSVMFIWAQLNYKWRITHNEFEQYSWGRADDSLARGAKRVRTTYPDVLEFLVGLGAGTMIVYSATGRTELRRLHNIPMLVIKRKRINAILESTLVTTDHTHAQVEAEEMESITEEAQGGGSDDKL